MKINELITALEEIRDKHDGDVKVVIAKNYLSSFKWGHTNKKFLEQTVYTDATASDLSVKRGNLVLKSKTGRAK